MLMLKCACYSFLLQRSQATVGLRAVRRNCSGRRRHLQHILQLCIMKAPAGSTPDSGQLTRVRVTDLP